MRTRLLAALVAASVTLVACGDTDDAPGDSASPASVDLDFQAMSVAGESVDAGSYAGSDLVIWFWAPW